MALQGQHPGLLGLNLENNTGHAQDPKSALPATRIDATPTAYKTPKLVHASLLVMRVQRTSELHHDLKACSWQLIQRGC